MSFFMCVSWWRGEAGQARLTLTVAVSGRYEGSPDQPADDAAHDRGHHRDPGGTPVGVAVAGDRQDGVCDTGTEVTSR